MNVSRVLQCPACCHFTQPMSQGYSCTLYSRYAVALGTDAPGKEATQGRRHDHLPSVGLTCQ